MEYVLKDDVAKQLKEQNKDLYEKVVSALKEGRCDDNDFQDYLAVCVEMPLANNHEAIDVTLRFALDSYDKYIALEERVWYDYSRLNEPQRKSLVGAMVVLQDNDPMSRCVDSMYVTQVAHINCGCDGTIEGNTGYIYTPLYIMIINDPKEKEKSNVQNSFI